MWDAVAPSGLDLMAYIERITLGGWPQLLGAELAMPRNSSVTTWTGLSSTTSTWSGEPVDADLTNQCEPPNVE